MIDKARIDELREVQGMALDHAVEEMQAAHALGLDSKDARGDRGWLTGMAAKSLGVAVKIEQLISLREGRGPGDDEDDEKAAAKMVRTARAEVAEILERASAGPQPRKKRGNADD